MRIYLNVERFQALATLRGWKHPQSELARLTGFTRQYIHLLVTHQCVVSSDFMSRYIVVCGHKFEDGDWGGLFTAKPGVGLDDPTFNYAKLRGEAKYAPYSMDYEFRKKDGGVEQREPDESLAPKRNWVRVEGHTHHFKLRVDKPLKKTRIPFKEKEIDKHHRRSVNGIPAVLLCVFGQVLAALITI